MSTTAPHHRTLWEEGRTPGPVVAAAFGVAFFVVARLDLAWFERVSLLSDVVFGLLCVAGALLVRPRDFFAVGVAPPLVMVVAFAVLTWLLPSAFGDPTDGPVQSVVSGLAHHARALVVGYGLTLAILALRQVALRHAGALHGHARAVPTAARRAPGARPTVSPRGAYPTPSGHSARDGSASADPASAGLGSADPAAAGPTPTGTGTPPANAAAHPDPQAGPDTVRIPEQRGPASYRAR